MEEELEGAGDRAPMNGEITKAAGNRRDGRSVAEEGGGAGGGCLDAKQFATWAKGKGRMIWWVRACRGDSRDAVMTPAEEGRKGHISIFPHPEIQTLVLFEATGHGVEDADYFRDLLSRIELQCHAKDRTEGSLRKASLG